MRGGRDGCACRTSVVFPRPESPTTRSLTCLRCHIFLGLGRRDPRRLALLVDDARTLMNSCSSEEMCSTVPAAHVQCGHRHRACSGQACAKQAARLSITDGRRAGTAWEGPRAGRYWWADRMCMAMSHTAAVVAGVSLEHEALAVRRFTLSLGSCVCIMYALSGRLNSVLDMGT